jgi:hypothetical protein
LEEVVSLDKLLCPPILREVKTEYWPHIVNEDFILHFFTDLGLMLGEVRNVKSNANAELSSKGLLRSLERACEVQQALRAHYEEVPHANYHVWALFRSAP